MPFLLYLTSLRPSSAIRSKMSLMNEFIVLMPLLDMLQSGCTCLSTCTRALQAQ